MSDLSVLKDSNGYIKIAAIDHRDSLKKILPEEELSFFKTKCTELFAPYCTSVLVDPEYGEDAVLRAKMLNLGILMTREASGYTENPQGKKTILYENFTSRNLKEMGASAIKLLIYYNSDSELAPVQLDTVRFVKEETVEAGLPLLLEIVTYPVDGFFYHRGDSILKAINDLRQYADVLKLEYPVEIIAGEQDEFDSAIPYLEEITTSSGNPWVLLSRGMKFDNYRKALLASKEAGCIGFAVGRAVWQEISTCSNKNERIHYLETTASERMKDLSQLF